MIILRIGVLMLLVGAAAMAQQFVPPGAQTQPFMPASPPDQQFVPPVPQPQPFMQASQPAPISEGERMRFQNIQAKRERGEPLSPDEQRFAQEFMMRLNQGQGIPGGQSPQPGAVMRTGQPPRPVTGASPIRQEQPALERALGVPGGKWWARPEMVQKLGLTADQTKKMDDIFQQHRLKLIDLHAVVQKEDAIMEPLIGAEQPDEAKIVAQIDKIVQARAELEKANARMLLGIRRLLTPEQWVKLKQASAAMTPPPPINGSAKR
jgi:Spy/CpxP family protein refolding chaperone